MNAAKEYLRKLYAAEIALSILEREIRRSQDENITERLQEAKKSYEEIRERITTQIVSLPDGRFQKVLYLAYVEKLPIWKIAQRMNYSQDHAHKLHRLALEAFEKDVLNAEE